MDLEGAKEFLFVSICTRNKTKSRFIEPRRVSKEKKRLKVHSKNEADVHENQ
jgi:hypothetical protein